MSDPWATASAQQGTESAESENLAGGYQDEESQLFSSGGGAGPSILNKTHLLGSKRTGIILKAPYDMQSRNIKGEPKFWEDGNNKPVTRAVNPATGKPNRKVLDTVFALQTEYRMDAGERAAIGRDASFEDDGKRSFSVGGVDLKVVKEAMRKAPFPITRGADLVGKRITIERVGQKPNAEGNPSWIIEVRFSEA